MFSSRIFIHNIKAMIAAGVLLMGASLSLAFSVPPLRAPINDYASLLNPQTTTLLDAALRRLQNEGGPQIAVLIVDSLEGLTIEQASIQVTDQWKLGNPQRDDGVLFMIAKGDRKLRIEVGQGLEGFLTDAQSKRIIDQGVVPLIRAGDFNSAVLVGVYRIAQLTAPDKDVNALFGVNASALRPHKSRQISAAGFFVLLVILLLLGRVMGSSGFRGQRSYWGYGGGGFGGRGGFGGGGGFSGGGGGFSGGGASGGW